MHGNSNIKLIKIPLHLAHKIERRSILVLNFVMRRNRAIFHYATFGADREAWGGVLIFSARFESFRSKALEVVESPK
jgi:hypothetical protein